MKAAQIKQLIESGLIHAEAIIETNDEVHFTAHIISPDFLNKNRVQRQQLVYGILDQQIKDGSIHAFSFKTFTPEEWDKLKT